MGNFGPQPVCRSCYQQRYPDRVPYRVMDVPMETCCFCAADTNYGLYERLDYTTVPYPSI